MRLYLVQHAKAVSKQQNPERPLLGQGRRDMQKIAAFVKPLGLCVDYLWHSPKRRAEQTAELLAQAVRAKQEPTVREGLGPNDDVTVLKDALASIEGDVMVVGHLPFLGRLASLLLAGSESADAVAFRNGGIVCLNRSDEKQWQIDWMVTPELLV